jgi:hypothetical protein
MQECDEAGQYDAVFIVRGEHVGDRQLTVEIRHVEPHGLRVPVGPAQQILEAIGGGLTADFCHLPAIFALGLTEQAAQVCHDPVAGL